MQKVSKLIAATTAAVLFATPALAQTATQSVAYEIQAINQVSISGSPSLTVNTATAGSAPTAATASATYAVTTNEASKKITVAIDQAMPSGVTLTMNMAAPTGGTSAGAITLSATEQNAVSEITTLNESGLAITYTLSATAAAGVVAASTRTVTLTIGAGV